MKSLYQSSEVLVLQLKLLECFSVTFGPWIWMLLSVYWIACLVPLVFFESCVKVIFHHVPFPLRWNMVEWMCVEKFATDLYVNDDI